jgi:hypothetical protein
MHFWGTCRDKLAFGEVRGGNTALASAFGVQSLPALLVVCNGDAATREAYGGDMKSDPIRGFLDQFAGGKRCRQVGQSKWLYVLAQRPCSENGCLASRATCKAVHHPEGG